MRHRNGNDNIKHIPQTLNKHKHKTKQNPSHFKQRWWRVQQEHSCREQSAWLTMFHHMVLSGPRWEQCHLAKNTFHTRPYEIPLENSIDRPILSWTFVADTCLHPWWSSHPLHETYPLLVYNWIHSHGIQSINYSAGTTVKITKGLCLVPVAHLAARPKRWSWDLSVKHSCS